MAGIFRRAQIVASPSIHDGTPNSLLEGIACGCFPIAGDLESIREWITPNENGLLFDLPARVPSRTVLAIENKNLREKAAGLTLRSLPLTRIQPKYANGRRVLRRGDLTI